MYTLASRWDEVEVVLRENKASDKQVAAMKHAFYAGAEAALTYVVALKDEPLHEETQNDFMQEWVQEIADYAAESDKS